jgi:hypothetical protein
LSYRSHTFGYFVTASIDHGADNMYGLHRIQSHPETVCKTKFFNFVKSAFAAGRNLLWTDFSWATHFHILFESRAEHNSFPHESLTLVYGIVNFFFATVTTAIKEPKTSVVVCTPENKI